MAKTGLLLVRFLPARCGGDLARLAAAAFVGCFGRQLAAGGRGDKCVRPSREGGWWLAVVYAQGVPSYSIGIFAR